MGSKGAKESRQMDGGESVLTFQPGDVYIAHLIPKDRPVIIISREELNRGDYVVAIPLTSARIEERESLGNCVRLRAGEFGLTKDCVAQAEMISFLPKSDLDQMIGPVGRLDRETLQEVIAAVGYVFNADCVLADSPTAAPRQETQE